MIRRRLIAFFLLSLLLSVNWHNTLLHAHHGTEEEGAAAVAYHHEHGHHHHAGHHHGPDAPALWDWIQTVLGDFEHPDLGENHLEVFLNPGNHTGGSSLSAYVFPIFTAAPLRLSFSDLVTSPENKIPFRVLSFSDPPFLDAVGNRGPPVFS